MAMKRSLALGGFIANLSSGDVVVPEDACDAAVKKARTDPTQSRVVHVRNVSSDATELDLVKLCSAFGKVKNHLMLKNKTQAFVEFQDLASAAAIIARSNTSALTIRGRPVFCQYSNHQELKVDPSQQNRGGTGAAGVPALLGVGQDAQMGGGLQLQQPNRILHVSIENQVCPIELETLHHIFSRFGMLLRIITFTKSDTFQALLEFADSISAISARTALNNRNIYNGCCMMRISHSKLTQLTVKFNNDKSYDFTNPDLPASEADLAYGSGIAMGLLGDAPTVRGGVGMGGFSPSAPTMNSAGTVVQVSNLDESQATCDGLFTLFGVYGDVQRVKIMHNRRNTALIQFTDSTQAQQAVQNLDNVTVWDKVIRVTSTKHLQVQLPREGQQGDELTKDYSRSSLHRFGRRPGCKNAMNICPPNATLHLSNIPEGLSEADIVSVFNEAGFSVANFKFFPSNHKMALLALESEEDAISALMAMHNYKLADQAHLRVTFAKSEI